MFLWESLLLSSSGKPSALYSWGYNSDGRTGLNTDALTNTLVPTLVNSTNNWSDISAALSHSLAISDGKLYSFGSNANGRTGLNTITGNTLVPTQIGTSATWTKCSAGGDHSVAIMNGEIYSWGNNGSGKTGLNTVSGNTINPTKIGTNIDWTDCSAGASYSLGIRNGELYAWGLNSSNQLGDGSVTTRIVPTRIGSFTDWGKCLASQYLGLAVRNGILYSWGINLRGTGQNLNSGNTTAPTIAQLQGTINNVTKITAGTFHSLMIADGSLYSCGLNTNARTGRNTISGETFSFTKIGSFVDWTDISADNFSSLAIRDGKLYSFGSNAGGRTGQNTITGNTLVPTQVGTDIGWTDCSVGYSHCLAIRNGELYSWGSNAFARTGQGVTSGQYLIPTKVGAFTDWTKCSAGTDHSLAIRDGKLYSFGSNANGRTGQNTITGNTLVPTQVGTDIGWTHCSAGSTYSLAIKNGELYSFGANTAGSTGQNTSTGDTIIPTKIGTAADWIYCYAGERSSSSVDGSSSFGIRGSGSFGDLYAWGHNANKLGLNISTDILIPTYVDAGECSAAVSSDAHSLFITKDTEIFGTGSNHYHRLGIDINAFSIIFYTLVSCGNTFENSTTIDNIASSYGAGVVISQGKLFSAGYSPLANSYLTRFIRITPFSDYTYCDIGGGSTIDNFLIAIRNGSLYVGGLNEYGKTGLNTITGSSIGFTKMNNEINWQSVSLGTQHSLGKGI